MTSWESRRFGADVVDFGVADTVGFFFEDEDLALVVDLVDTWVCFFRRGLRGLRDLAAWVPELRAGTIVFDGACTVDIAPRV